MLKMDVLFMGQWYFNKDGSFHTETEMHDLQKGNHKVEG
jgi:hypothetical protein